MYVPALCTMVYMHNNGKSSVIIISARQHATFEALKNEVVQQRAQSDMPILAICAREHMPTLLDSGADDCIEDGCSDVELRARLRALQRRGKKMKFKNTRVNSGKLIINTKYAEVYIDDTKVPLAPSEYRIFLYLSLHHGRLVDRESLGLRVMQEPDWSSTHLLNMHIYNLRKKLGSLARIVTVPRRGFVLE